MTEVLPPWLLSMQKIMRYIPHTLIALIILFTIYFAVTGNTNLLIKTPLLFVPLLITAIFLIVKKPLKCSNTGFLFTIKSSTGVKIVYTLICLLIITTLTSGYQSALFFYLTIGIYCVILLQSLSDNVRVELVLGELILITAIITFPQFFSHGLLYGCTDLISHYEWAETIVNSAHASTGTMGVYGTYCLYHVLIAIFSIISEINTPESLYIVSTVAVLISIPFIYKLAYHFTKMKNISILASFFYAVMPMILHALVTPAPRVMATMAFIIALYIFFVLHPKYKKVSLLLLIVMIIYMAIVHHAQLLFILLVMGLLLLGGVLFHRKEVGKRLVPIVMSFLIPVISLCVGYKNEVIYIIKDRFFANIGSMNLKDTENLPSSTPATPPVSPPIESPIGGDVTSIPPTSLIPSESTPIHTAVDSGLAAVIGDGYISSVLSMASSAVILVFGLIGIYYLLTHSRTVKQYFVLLPLLLVMFIFFVPGVMDIFPFVTNSLQVYRLRYVLVPFFVIAMAVGCILILQQNTKRGGGMQQTIVVILGILLIISSVPIHSLSDNAVPNESAIIKPTEKYFSEEHVSLLNLFPTIIQSGETITSDHSTMSYIQRTLMLQREYMINKNLIDLFDSESASTVDGTYIIFPTYKYTGNAGINLHDSQSYNEQTFILVRESDSSHHQFLKNNYLHDTVYDNKDCQLYYSPRSKLIV